MNHRRPDYEALDRTGTPYIRPAQTIGELPTLPARRAACEESTKAIEATLGIKAQRCVAFGLPVYASFMTAPEARKHPQHALLATRGCDVALDLCPSYRQPDEDHTCEMAMG